MSTPIPIPWRTRWTLIRLKVLPGLIFGLVVVGVAILWKDYAAAPTLVGQVEAVEAKVTCDKPGRLGQLSVSRFQKIKAGDPVGQVVMTAPKNAVAESKLHLTETELSPVVLRAPIDGMVETIYHRSGEAITTGEPIVGIAPSNGTRIVGYLRPPLQQEPKVGSRVEVRTRNNHRQLAAAEIVEVGAQFEAIAPALQPPTRVNTVELGLPLSISLPAGLHVRPGELVDLKLLPER